MNEHIRHQLTGDLMRLVAQLNGAIAEHAGEECDLVLSWTREGRVRTPRLLANHRCQPDALSESEPIV